MQQQRRAPQLPKIEDDGNPRFVMFIRTANVYFWYPLNVVTGGTTAKIMLASKDNFLGKYIYKDTLARNLAAVIYKENGNIRSALMTSNVIEITGSALSKDAEQAEGEEEKFRSKRRKKRKSK
ncbi:protein HHL1, chloroplastic-like isoform X6 [Phragmites australis]|nr:protein HHL1, chloroplastic-like isoform X6 [Phragmites australis]